MCRHETTALEDAVEELLKDAQPLGKDEFNPSDLVISAEVFDRLKRAYTTYDLVVYHDEGVYF